MMANHGGLRRHVGAMRRPARSIAAAPVRGRLA
jgi:hypothetical protein